MPDCHEKEGRANKSRQKGELLGAGSSHWRHTLVIAASNCPSGPPRERLLRRGRGSWLSDCEYGSGCGAYIVSRALTQKANTHCAPHPSEVTALPLSASNSLIITSAVYVPSPFLSTPHNLLLAKLSAHDEVTMSNLWDAVTKANN